ncbi:MAG: hypothetical protein ACRCSF_06465 [Mycobacteriaceae bacterium]
MTRLSHTSYRNHRFAAIACTLSLGIFSACSGTTGIPNEAGSSQSLTTTSAQQPANPTSSFTITDEAAVSLCTEIDKQIQSWNTYTSTINRIGLNGLVLDWGVRNQVDLLALVQNREAVDTAMIKRCNTTHKQALRALESSSIAELLVGLSSPK